MAEPMHISASQLGTWHDCKRKWWLEKVVKLPSVPRGYLTFGTVLHACLERWASADALGRGPDGKVVDVFPTGWTTEEGQTVTPNEAALIRRLVDQAVERGIVQRGDGRVLEREVRLPVIDGVELVGFIDVFVPSQHETTRFTGEQACSAPPRIEDHKTFGEGSVRFLKQASEASPNYLGKDPQLLTYAAATSRLDGWGGPVVVRHNQFPKFEDGRGARTVEAVVTAEALGEHWLSIQAAAAEMLLVRNTKRWDDVPGPYGTDVCSKYGGCPFREICGRRSTLEGYKGRVEKQLAQAQAPRPNISTEPRRGTKNMTDSNDIFARAKRRGSAQPEAAQVSPFPGNVAAPSVTPPVVLPASAGINGGAPPAPATPTPPTNAPPWANPNCTACKGTGFNSQGRPCPLCDALAKRQKRPTSSMYLITGDVQAGFEAKQRPEKVADLFALGAPEAWSSKAGAALEVQRAHPPSVSTSAAPAAVAPAAAPAPAGGTYAITQDGISSEPIPFNSTNEQRDAILEKMDTPDAKAKRGRKPAGLTILVGCAQIKGPDRATETAQGLLARLGAELAKDMGAESYWALDAFKRRDRLKQRAAEIVEALGTTTLIVAGLRDPDVDSLVSSLMPYAQTVVEGLR